MIYTPVEWSEDLILGLPQFDEDHRTLVQMVNNVFLGVCAQLDESILSTACDDLIHHTQGHFLREELAMERHFYAGLAAHKAEHTELLDALGGALRTITAVTEADQFIVAQRSLGRWLTEHILNHDKHVVDFILEKAEPQVA